MLTIRHCTLQRGDGCCRRKSTRHAEVQYQELLGRLLAEGPKAPADRTISQAVAAALPSLGLSPQVGPVVHY